MMERLGEVSWDGASRDGFSNWDIWLKGTKYYGIFKTNPSS